MGRKAQGLKPRVRKPARLKIAFVTFEGKVKAHFLPSPEDAGFFIYGIPEYSQNLNYLTI
jgi:hypothetical protein